MRLIYTKSRKEVKVGDRVKLRDGRQWQVTYFAQPHKPSSEGKVTVETVKGKRFTMEYYVSVIGAEWIEREDRT